MEPTQERLAEKQWKPTDLKTCTFNEQRFKNLMPQLKFDTWSNRVDAVLTLLIPALFLGTVVARGFQSAMNNTSDAVSQKRNGFFSLVTALFIFWGLKILGFKFCLSGGMDYALVGGVTALALFGTWFAKKTRMKKIARETNSKYCPRCVEVAERIFVFCPKCGKKLSKNVSGLV